VGSSVLPSPIITFLAARRPSTWVKQILYHGVFSLMHMAGDNSILRLHGSRKGPDLALALCGNRGWGRGFPPR